MDCAVSGCSVFKVFLRSRVDGRKRRENDSVEVKILLRFQ